MSSSPFLSEYLTSSVAAFSRFALRIPLRPYQFAVAEAIVHSVLTRLGLSFVVIFPRQSGKNEVQAHLEAYLLYLLSDQEIEIVSVSPTFKPQALNAMDRLHRCLERSPLTRDRWRTRAGSSILLDRACVHFFSGSSVAHTVGATASALLSIDEAQDIRPSIYDHKFAPMAASTNATRVFWGTPWTSSTLLSREKRQAEYDQQKDGIQRLWLLTADDVTAVHPLYGDYVAGVIRRFGRTHPLVRTQYFSEEIDSSSAMFNPSRLARIFPGLGQPPALAGTLPASEPSEGSGDFSSSDNLTACAFLLDVAGQDESRLDFTSEDTPLENPARDSTTLSIVGIDLSTLPTLSYPSYRVLHRQAWIGASHLTIFASLKNLVALWSPQYIVMDATGVGEGLWALLDKAFPTRVIPVKFTLQSKSEIGWKFLAIIDTGRFMVMEPDEIVRLQYASCLSTILPGPSKTLRWSVPEGTRGPDGQLIHDDFILADSLVAELDKLKWFIHFDSLLIPGDDPLERRMEY